MWRRERHPLPWLAGAVVILGACGLTARSGEAPSEEPRGTVYLPGGRSLSVEVADTPAKQARGYMFRKSVPEGEGMIFLMAEYDIHSFWMKNCLVPLDIIWLDEDWRVVHVAESVPPCEGDVCPPVVPMHKSRYVLEVAAGTSGGLGLARGAVIRYAPPSSAAP